MCNFVKRRLCLDKPQGNFLVRHIFESKVPFLKPFWIMNDVGRLMKYVKTAASMQKISAFEYCKKWSNSGPSGYGKCISFVVLSNHLILGRKLP